MKKQRVERSADEMLKAFEYKLYSMKADRVESTTAVEATDIDEAFTDPIYRDEIWIDSPDDEEYYDDEFEEKWDLIARKDIKDADGFMTEYSLYGSNTGRIVTVYGDHDIYTPENGDIDEEFESLQEAEEWFYDFDPFNEDW